MTEAVPPPSPKKEFHRVASAFGDERIDPYFWMRAKNWQDLLEHPETLEPEIREHLEAENRYYEAYAAKYKNIKEAVAAEMTSRIVPEDASVPERDGAWEYWKEFRKGGNYAVHMRRNLNDASVQTVIDGDKESPGSKFFNMPEVHHSPDHKTVAYFIDREGSEYFDLRFRDIATGQDSPETIKRTFADNYGEASSLVWSADSKRAYYIECDENHRTKVIKCHTVGTDPQQDAVIYSEPDDTFEVSLHASQSGEYFFITSSESDTTEVRFLRTDAAPGTPPTLVAPRIVGQRYDVEHHGDKFFIRTNADGAVNYKLMSTPVGTPGRENWTDVKPYDPARAVEDIVALKNHLIIRESVNALPQITVSDYNGGEYKLEFPDDAYDITIKPGFEYDTDTLRIAYDTPADPGKVYDVDLLTKAETVRKQIVLPSGHDPDDYVIERKNIKARDGADIPVTILRHKDTPVDGTAPLYQYGYGSYGMAIPSYFVNRAISLADRGAIYAVAHIRGGGDKGQSWYYDGKMEKKDNTFNDFIDVTEALTDQGYGQKGKVIMEGRSAGGLLMGAVLNKRRDLYGGAVAGVPFVDVMNTMTDDTLPLTPGEWTEWGNPITDKAAYDRMNSYSPYDNVDDKGAYPMILATAGIADFRVTYWEPAKWIARLREVAHGGPFFLKTNMAGGHQGSAARFGKVDEDSELVAAALHRFEELGYDISLKVHHSPAANPSGGYESGHSSGGTARYSPGPGL